MHDPASPGAGRYAPSPSGDLHLGNLRTAILAWLLARQEGLRFVMRIEDLDRVRPGEGPDTPNTHPTNLHCMSFPRSCAHTSWARRRS